MSVTDRLVSLTTVPVLYATASLAQTADPRESARTHVGPFYLTPSLGIDELGIDTNIFNNPTELADFTFTVVPGVNVAVPFGSRAVVTASTFADFIYYNHYASERSVNPDIKVRGEYAFNRLTFFVSPSYSSSRRQPSLEIDQRVRHSEMNLRGGAIVQISKRPSVEAAGGVSSVSYDGRSIFDNTFITGFRFPADHDLPFSCSQSAPYSVVNEYGVGIDRHLGDPFEATGGVDWLRHSYRTSAGIEPATAKTPVDRLTTWSLGVGSAAKLEPVRPRLPRQLVSVRLEHPQGSCK